MAYNNYKTENGQHKSRAGQTWDGRLTVKPVARRLRRINDKAIIAKELEELADAESCG